MYSPELIKFLLNYNVEEEKSSRKVYNFKDGNSVFAYKKLAPVTISVKSK